MRAHALPHAADAAESKRRSDGEHLPDFVEAHHEEQ
jgi:hypothetical protein